MREKLKDKLLQNIIVLTAEIIVGIVQQQQIQQPITTNETYSSRADTERHGTLLQKDDGGASCPWSIQRLIKITMQTRLQSNCITNYTCKRSNRIIDQLQQSHKIQLQVQQQHQQWQQLKCSYGAFKLQQRDASDNMFSINFRWSQANRLRSALWVATRQS